jgi:hypothetical protein
MPLPFSPPINDIEALAVFQQAQIEANLFAPPAGPVTHAKVARIAYSAFHHNPAPALTPEAMLAVGAIGVAAVAGVLLFSGVREKVMDVDFQPFEFPEIRLHILGRRLEGEYASRVTNTGELPLFSSTVTEQLNEAVTQAQSQLLGYTKQAGYMAAKAVWDNRHLFQLSGWDILKALWDFFVHKRITIRSTVRISEVVFFAKDFDIVATIPIRKLSISLR